MSSGCCFHVFCYSFLVFCFFNFVYYEQFVLFLEYLHILYFWSLWQLPLWYRCGFIVEGCYATFGSLIIFYCYFVDGCPKDKHTIFPIFLMYVVLFRYKKGDVVWLSLRQLSETCKLQLSTAVQVALRPSVMDTYQNWMTSVEGPKKKWWNQMLQLSTHVFLF